MPQVAQRLVILPLVLAVAGTLAAGGPRIVAGAPPHLPLRTAAIVMLDDFEDPAWPDPRLWQLDPARPTGTVPSWWPSACQARSGNKALWAFGGRIGDISQPCGAGAPLASVTRAVLNLDLRNAQLASRLELAFEVWMKLPAGEGNGLVINYLTTEPDGSLRRAPVFAATGSSGVWTFPERLLDLMNLADVADSRRVYDLRGRVARLEWVASAPGGTDPGSGIYIDRLRLVWEPDAALPAPTARPTAPPLSPTPSRSPTPTATATLPVTATLPPSATPTKSGITLPTFTPTATRRPRGQIWLPWLEAPEVATEEPTG